MTQPFVISMKFTSDASGVKAANDGIRQDLTRVGQSLDTARVKAIELQGALQRISAVNATGINSALGVKDDFGGAARGADVAAYGAELDRLRAKLNPLYAAIRQYRTEVSAVRQAHSVGAISADEMTAAINRERTAALGSIAAIKQRNQALSDRPSVVANGASGYTGNIAAQFQDIGVTAAAGHNPFQIALQQGTQLSAVFEQMKANGQAVGPALLTSFTSIISPISLITIGLIAAGAAATQWLGSMLPRMETARQALDRHNDEIRKIVDGYDGAQGAINDYVTSTTRLPRESLSLELGAQLRELRKAQSDFLEKARNLGPALSFGNDTEKEMGRLLVGFSKGEIAADDLHAGLTRIKTTDLGPLGFQIKNVAGELLDALTTAIQFNNALVATDHALAAASVNGSLQRELDSRKESERATVAHEIELDAINAKTPAQLADIARRRVALDLRDEEISESLRQQKIDQAGAVAYAQAARGLADADRNRLLSLRDVIASSEIELSLVGRGVEETERLTFARQNLAAAEAEAARNGTKVSAAYRDQVEQLAASYGKLKQQIALRSLEENLAFDRAQLGRTATEQAVASALRPIFGTDLSSEQAQFYAGQVRVNEELKQFSSIGRELTGGFLSDLKAGLLDGVSGFDALRNAGANAFDQLSDRALSMAADGIFDLIFSAFAGAIGGGGGLGRMGSFSIGGLPTYAAGTSNHPGGLARINEGGRGEIVDLPNGTRVIPHDISKAMAQAGNGGMVVQIIEQRSTGSIRQERSQGANGEEIVRMIVRDELPAAYGDALRRAAI